MTNIDTGMTSEMLRLDCGMHKRDAERHCLPEGMAPWVIIHHKSPYKSWPITKLPFSIAVSNAIVLLVENHLRYIRRLPTTLMKTLVRRISSTATGMILATAVSLDPTFLQNPWVLRVQFHINILESKCWVSLDPSISSITIPVDMAFGQFHIYIYISWHFYRGIMEFLLIIHRWHSAVCLRGKLWMVLPKTNSAGRSFGCNPLLGCTVSAPFLFFSKCLATWHVLNIDFKTTVWDIYVVPWLVTQPQPTYFAQGIDDPQAGK